MIAYLLWKPKKKTEEHIPYADLEDHAKQLVVNILVESEPSRQHIMMGLKYYASQSIIPITDTTARRITDPHTVSAIKLAREYMEQDPDSWPEEVQLEVMSKKMGI